MRNQRKNRLIIAGIVALLVASFEPAFVGNAHAAVPQFGKAFVRLNRLYQNQVTGGTICAFTPASGSIGSEAFVDIGFPFQQGVANDFVLATQASGLWTVNTNGDPDGVGTANGSLFWPSGAVAWPGITAPVAGGVDTANHIVRFASTALSASTWYCFNFGAALTNADAGFIETSPGYIETFDNTGTGGTPGSGVAQLRTNWGTDIVGLDGINSKPLDQIIVNAIVPPLFQFDLSGTIDTIPATGNLNYQAVNESGGITVTVHTNAKSGWIAWSKSANQGLKSVSAGNYVIPTVAWGANPGTPTTLTAGTEDYGLVVSYPGTQTSTCTTTIAPEYNGGANQVGRMTANFQQIASCDGGTSNGDTLTIKERATISAVTPAATDYTDTLTVVGAGDF